MIELPAYDQGLPVQSATDRQLIEWRNELEAIIRQSPIAIDHTDEIVALEAALAETRETAQRLGTSGAWAQVQLLESQREGLAEHAPVREAWLEENASVLHRYSSVVEELRHRVNARVAAYELVPPEDVVEALGPVPSDLTSRRKWISAVSAYAEARMASGPDADLTDPALLSAAGWRDAVARYTTKPLGVDFATPVFRRAM